MQLMPFHRDCLRVGVYEPDKPFQVAEINPKNFKGKNSYHNLLHILGKYHEHQRPDRDEYILVEWNNIKEGNVQQSLHLFTTYSLYIYIHLYM